MVFFFTANRDRMFLVDVTLPNSLEEIGIYAFANQCQLTDVIFSNRLKYIF